MREDLNKFDDHVISWEAPEFIQHDRSWKWYLVAGLAVFAFLVYSVLTNNWTLVLAILVLSGVYFWEHGKTPKHVRILVSRTGIKVGDREIPYQNIKSFWILYKPGNVTTLNLRSASKLQPDLSIDLDTQDPAELRTFLCAHVREEEGRDETFTEALIRILKL